MLTRIGLYAQHLFTNIWFSISVLFIFYPLALFRIVYVQYLVYMNLVLGNIDDFCLVGCLFYLINANDNNTDVHMYYMSVCVGVLFVCNELRSLFGIKNA